MIIVSGKLYVAPVDRDAYLEECRDIIDLARTRAGCVDFYLSAAAPGNADEQKEAKRGTVEGWARSVHNPVGGWYGLRKGYRGRFGNYVPPVLELLGLAEVEHQPRNNRMRAR